MTTASGPRPSFARSAALVRSDFLQRFLAFGALILLIIFFSLANEHFLNFENFVNILIATAVVGVIALGETFVIITGSVDLSIGSLLVLSSTLGVDLMYSLNLSLIHI